MAHYKPNISEGEKPNTYLYKLGALREEKPPWNWDDQPAQLGISPDMLNDPAFSEYDLSQLRTFKQDPRLRDELDLGIVGTKKENPFAKSPGLHQAYGFTYAPDRLPYDPNKVYMRDYGELALDKLKMAVGPGAEQTKQGNINKEIASTISHEFRHNLFDQPEYSGIIDAAYNRFGGWGGNISRSELEEYINRAADIQLIPGDWNWADFNLPESLENYQDKYNRKLIRYGMPAHLTPMNTTKQFHRAATDFFNKVRREKLKRPTQINIQKQAIGMPEHLTPPPKRTYTPPRGGGADVMPTPPPRKTYVSPARPHGNGRDRGEARDYGKTETRASSGWESSPFAKGGLIDIPLSGRSRYI